MKEVFADHPRVRSWCEKYHFGIKLGGVYAQAEAPVVIDADTDTLMLARPEALLAALADPARRMAWNPDVSYFYAYPEARLRAVLGELLGKLPHRLNGGFLVVKNADRATWDHLERVLERIARDRRINPYKVFMHQTLWAILASRMGPGAAPLPPEYGVIKGRTPAGAVFRHYVGNGAIRPRFFSEGVPMVVADAVARGQLPADFIAAATDAAREGAAARPASSRMISAISAASSTENVSGSRMSISPASTPSVTGSD
jgi:hypothetical protein